MEKSTRKNPTPKTSQTLHAIGNIYLIHSTTSPDLPVPNYNMARTLHFNPNFFLKPLFPKAKHHDAAGALCHCISITIHNTTHRAVCIPDTCIKKAHLAPEAFDMTPNPTINRLAENPSRCFIYDAANDQHVLQVPQPFLISPRWQGKPYLPSLAKEDSPNYLELHFSILRPSIFTKLAELYVAGPETWNSTNHPIFNEPHRDDELARCSSTLYGVESLFRISLIQHPAKLAQFPLYVACNPDTFIIPILNTTIANKFAVDDFLQQHLRPFYADGSGSILCPICIINTSTWSPVVLDKNNFIIHYRNRHFNFSITTGLSSPTAYHARQYQTDLLYNFCLAHPNTTTKPSQSHLTKDWKSFPNLTSSDSLAKLLAQKLNLNPSGTSTPGTSSSSSDSSTADRDALAVALVSSGILEDKKKGKKH
jgi:hypothetical protein